jgi:hypothetical protein
MVYQKKGNNGGPRPGAGRKPKATKNETAISKAEKQIKDRLPEIVATQIELALGTGDPIIEEKWLPAALVTVGSGALEMRAFPLLPPEELVLVERKVINPSKDRAAGQYLINRLAGSPAQQIKSEITGKDGSQLQATVIILPDNGRSDEQTEGKE